MNIISKKEKKHHLFRQAFITKYKQERKIVIEKVNR